MQINVAQLLKWPVGTTRIHPIDAGQSLQLDEETTARIGGGRVRLDRIDTGILARGDVEADVELECSRCLEPYTAPLRIHFEEEYAPSVEVHSGVALPPPEDDLTFTIDANHILDLSEALRQNIIANLPIQPVCRAGCAGLCPICGGNRNLDPCTCAEDQEGNRPFAALRGLLH